MQADFSPPARAGTAQHVPGRGATILGKGQDLPLGTSSTKTLWSH